VRWEKYAVGGGGTDGLKGFEWPTDDRGGTESAVNNRIRDDGGREKIKIVVP